MIILTEAERNKFVLFLKQEAQSYDLILEECSKLPFMPEPIEQHLRAKAVMYSSVANELEKVEQEEILGGGE